MTASPPASERGASSGPSGYLLAAGVLFLVAPVALLAWVLGTAALRYGARRWVLALCGLVPGVVAAMATGPKLAAVASVTAAQVFGAVGTPTVAPGGLLGPLAAWFGRWTVLTAPVGVPMGMVAAAVPPPQPALPAPEWEARRQRDRERDKARTRKRAVRRAEREGADLRSNALAVSMGGMVASWRIGDLIVPPEGQLGLAWLLVGAPGAGKTTAIERLAFLAGQEKRHLVVADAKGGHDGLADGVVAAYLAAFPDARIRLFPNERLDIWRGGAQAVVNRLVEVWDWTAESSWWREVAMTALRLALGQPGPSCQSSAELVRRLNPDALERAWEHDPEILALVRSMAKGKQNDLGGVLTRVSNLVAALGGALDGELSWEDADLWVVTVPAMVASRDADSALRVLLSDYGHFTMARKGRRPSLLIVDEFSAIAGGRRSAIDLLERGRGAGAGVILAGQSAVALGNEEERARLLAAASAILLFRTPQPSELAALAGTERVTEGAWQAEDEVLTGRQTITMRARARVDQDQVRQLGTGEAELIVRGLAERVRIIRTRIPASIETVARGLVGGGPSRAIPAGQGDGDSRAQRRQGSAPLGLRQPAAGVSSMVTRTRELPSGEARPRPAGAASGDPDPEHGPAGAVASRVSGPPPAPQGQAPTGSPAASLAPPSSSPIRRYRPGGPGGESSPPDDRNQQEGMP